VDTLDELEECDYLTCEQRTVAEAPYPPSVGAECLETLRRRRWWLRAGLSAALVGTIVAATGAMAGWGVPGMRTFFVGVLPGLVAATGIGMQRLVAVKRPFSSTQCSNASTVWMLGHLPLQRPRDGHAVAVSTRAHCGPRCVRRVAVRPRAEGLRCDAGRTVGGNVRSGN